MPALILCIDTQSTALLARQTVLATGKHEVVSAENPIVAMELFLSLPVDMVVVDDYLYDTTGVALARCARVAVACGAARRRTARVPLPQHSLLL